MLRLLRRLWRYATAALAGRLDEGADPKVQLEQAIAQSEDQHRRLQEQAANVIANQTQTALRLDRALDELEKVNRSARQAVVMSAEAEEAGASAKLAEYRNAAESFAFRLVTLERDVASMRDLHLQATGAADEARTAVARNAVALQEQLAERQRLLSQLDQATMQEQVNAAMASLGTSQGDDGPALAEVRDKIEARYARASGMAELANDGLETAMIDVEQAAMRREASQRLAEIRTQLGIGPSGAVGQVGTGED